jgi:ribosome-associated toxin RatA of RatAB toxin-antitoxin module
MEDEIMPEYQRSTTIDATPDELFDFLSKVENLPKYFSRMTEAHSATGDEVHVTAKLPPEATEGDGSQTVESYASFSIDADNRAVSWGSENEHHYRGELKVSPAGDDGAEVVVTLHTEHDDAAINDGIDETLRNIKGLVAKNPPLQS